MGFLDVKSEGVYLIEERCVGVLARRLLTADSAEREHWFREMGSLIADVAREEYNMDGYCNAFNWSMLNDRCVLRDTVFIDDGRQPEDIVVEIMGNMKPHVLAKHGFIANEKEKKAFLQGLGGLAEQAKKLF